MQTVTVPTCPKCIGGGKVVIIDSSGQDCSVFLPLPVGTPGTFLCSACGWAEPVSEGSSPIGKRLSGSEANHGRAY